MQKIVQGADQSTASNQHALPLQDSSHAEERLWHCPADKQGCKDRAISESKSALHTMRASNPSRVQYGIELTNDII